MGFGEVFWPPALLAPASEGFLEWFEVSFSELALEVPLTLDPALLLLELARGEPGRTLDELDCEKLTSKGFCSRERLARLNGLGGGRTGPLVTARPAPFLLASVLLLVVDSFSSLEVMGRSSDCFGGDTGLGWWSSLL